MLRTLRYWSSLPTGKIPWEVVSNTQQPVPSVESKMRLKASGGPSSLTDPVLIPPFLTAILKWRVFPELFGGYTFFWAPGLLHELMKHRQSNFLLLSPI